LVEIKKPRAQAIVADLQRAGYEARRLTADEARPSVGAWVHGVFTQADEGNRLHRPVIGFGSGQATMQLYVTLTDLASPQKPLYESAEKRHKQRQARCHHHEPLRGRR